MAFILLHICLSLNVLNSCFGVLSWNIFSLVLSCTRSSRTSLDAADAVKRQTSSNGFIQGYGLTQLFSNRFLSIPGGPRIHMNNTGCLDLNHMPQIPEADFSVLNSHVISAHCTGIETESLCPILCVFVCHFLLSLVHKNSDKWVWLSNLLRKSSNFKVVMHFGLVHLRSSHLCVIYRQMSIIVLFVCLKKPAALPCAQMNPSTT